MFRRKVVNASETSGYVQNSTTYVAIQGKLSIVQAKMG
jgi:hypothetical protein